MRASLIVQLSLSKMRLWIVHEVRRVGEITEGDFKNKDTNEQLVDEHRR